MNTKSFDSIVYHEGCPDGIMGLWCTQLSNSNCLTTIYPCKAGSDPTTYFEHKNVIFVDICPSIDYILKLVDCATNITILDHHKSSASTLENNKELLSKYSNIQIIFDMEKSGCQLAWDYFFEGSQRPYFVDYVGDRDLWQWKLPMSKELNNALWENNYFNPTDFTKLNQLYDSTDMDKDKEDLIAFGKILGNIQSKEIQYCVDQSLEAVMQVNDTKYRVWLSSNYKYRSEIGSILCDKLFSDGILPDFAVTWKYNIIDDNWFISMRGKDRVDLSVIAQQFTNGGGHKNASGCTIDSLKKYITLVTN